MQMPAGYSGFSGLSGQSGISGLSGFSGIPRISGLSGIARFSGLSGFCNLLDYFYSTLSYASDFFSFFVQTTFSYYFCLYYSRFDACFILFAPVISRFYKNLSNFLFYFGGEYKKVTIFAQEILSLKRETTLFQS